MKTRRNFLKTTGTGIILSSAIPGVAANLLNETRQTNITVGVIGAENSHTAGFGRLFNIDKKFPGVELKYVWGETDEFAKAAMEKGNIQEQVKDPKEMLGNIDALIVDHRHPKFHLEAAQPFIEAGVPTFIDKPFCYRAAAGREFLRIAKNLGTPVTSFSSISQSTTTYDIMDQLKSNEEVTQVVRTGTVDLDSKYGGVFFYGVHIVEPLMYMFGDDVREVRINRNGNTGNATLRFSSGLFATLIFKRKAYGWETFIETGDNWVELKSRVEETDPAKNYVDMVEMFRTGKEPRSHQSILNTISVLEALEKSAETEKWTEVEFQKL